MKSRLDSSGNPLLSAITIKKPTRSVARRACLACREKKVKCDGVQVCRNCQQANIQCIFVKSNRGGRRTTSKNMMSMESPTQSDHSIYPSSTTFQQPTIENHHNSQQLFADIPMMNNNSAQFMQIPSLDSNIDVIEKRNNEATLDFNNMSVSNSSPRSLFSYIIGEL